ncbi:hypothetical protein [Achromobacter sp. MFA1 R4]|uniref:hypothetical protein n=1 Tax=Achromobacter sp. MFA1 R4 TaxID=1881016 RepID=UPI001E4C2C05|nr:hypothetical protein [Achromobacter sp. MFA1 R4]
MKSFTDMCGAGATCMIRTAPHYRDLEWLQAKENSGDSRMANLYTKSEIERLLGSTDRSVVADALLNLCFNSDDPEWILDKCIQAIKDGGDDEIKGLAITCIGHVARMHKRIDRNRVMPILDRELDNPVLSGRAQDALDDIDQFVE